MMAKMFYTLDEAKTALGKSEDEIKQFSREGRLREFRDGPRLMFKADQVEALKKELANPQADLGPSDSGIGLSPGDAKSASGASMTLSEEPGGRSPGASMKMEDEAGTADIGLSGTSGVPSPARPSGSGTGLSGSAGTRGGIDVFHADEVEKVDPSAQTVVAKSKVGDQLSLEGGVGSGSGLLDLTRESDDTSLGAELLDEISPAKGKKSRPGESVSSGVMPGESVTSTIIQGLESTAPRPGLSVPVYVEAPDPWAPAFGSASLGTAALVIFGGFVLICAIAGTSPDIIRNLAKYGLWALWGMGVGIAVVFLTIGLLIGKVTSK
jgi:hypothetical protein